jgi:guanine nucleotide-binding protein G(i) subunit alpha
MDSAQAIVMALRKFKLDPVESVNRAYADKILDYRIDIDPSQALSLEMVTAVESLWHDPIIPTVLDRQSEFYLMDSASYFFDEIARIGKPDYIPNEMDVLKARTKTTGISETKFRSGQLGIHMFDVGGQRSERKKVSSYSETFLTLTDLSSPVVRFERPVFTESNVFCRIHCFEAVTSIIFCVALSEYDQVLLEESGQVRLANRNLGRNLTF